MKTLAQFKSEWIGKQTDFMETVTHCKCESYDKDSTKYLIALNKTIGYGWSVVYAERKDGKQMQDGEVNINAFGATYADCIDSFYFA